MAKYIVPPNKSKNPILLKCFKCKTLYSPDGIRKPFTTSDEEYYEKCPKCKYEYNNRNDIIPLWQYNLIKAWREYKNKEEKT